MGSLPLWKGATMRTIRIHNNHKHCALSKFTALFAQNVTSYPPPPTHAFLKWPFLTDFKKYTHTPPKGTKFWRIGPKIYKTRKSAKTHCVGAL